MKRFNVTTHLVAEDIEDVEKVFEQQTQIGHHIHITEVPFDERDVATIHLTEEQLRILLRLFAGARENGMCRGEKFINGLGEQIEEHIQLAAKYSRGEAA